MSLEKQIKAIERLRANGSSYIPCGDDHYQYLDNCDLETLISIYSHTGTLPPRRGMSKKMYRLYLIQDQKRVIRLSTATGVSDRNFGAREIRRTFGL